jgi:signal peptidase II
MKSPLEKIFTPLLVSCCVFSLDQLAKHWAVSALGAQPADGAAILGGSIGFAYTVNRGAAFGVLAGSDALFIIIAVAVVIVALASILSRTATRFMTLCALGLQMGGSAGNLADRVHNGYVIDFIYVRHFPVFNVADLAIVVGTCLLAWVWFRSGDKALGRQRALQR